MTREIIGIEKVKIEIKEAKNEPPSDTIPSRHCVLPDGYRVLRGKLSVVLDVN